jgi:hypothetical protein
MMEVVAVVRCMAVVVVVQLGALVMGFVGAKMGKDGGALDQQHKRCVPILLTLRRRLGGRILCSRSEVRECLQLTARCKCQSKGASRAWDC